MDLAGSAYAHTQQELKHHESEKEWWGWRSCKGERQEQKCKNLHVSMQILNSYKTLKN